MFTGMPPLRCLGGQNTGEGRAGAGSLRPPGDHSEKQLSGVDLGVLCQVTISVDSGVLWQIQFWNKSI